MEVDCLGRKVRIGGGRLDRAANRHAPQNVDLAVGRVGDMPR
jgi:hypothetical protein